MTWQASSRRCARAYVERHSTSGTMVTATLEMGTRINKERVVFMKVGAIEIKYQTAKDSKVAWNLSYPMSHVFSRMPVNDYSQRFKTVL